MPSKSPNLFLSSLRNFLDMKGLVHSKVAEKAGLSKSQFSAILNGSGNVTLDTLDKIAAALDVLPIELLGLQPLAKPTLESRLEALEQRLEARPSTRVARLAEKLAHLDDAQLQALETVLGPLDDEILPRKKGT